MTFQYSLSTRLRPDGKSEIYMRICINRNQTFRIKTGLFIKPSCFRNNDIYIPRVGSADRADAVEAQSSLLALGEHIIKEYDAEQHREDIDKVWMKACVQRYHIPQDRSNHTSVTIIIGHYLSDNLLAANTKRNFENLSRIIQRFEVIRGKAWGIEVATTDELREFKHFLLTEGNYKKDPKWATLYKGVKISQRGQNTIAKTLSQLRTVFKWAHTMGYTTVQPFQRFKVEQERYGTPYFLTLEERDRVAALRLEDDTLATYRDIFILQCYIGCRVSDLFRLGPDNVVEGHLEYVPLKTSKETMQYVRIPLHPVAAGIVLKYHNKHRATLFRRELQAGYNHAIKQLLSEAEITRIVSVINPLTMQEERRRICDVGASHLARRTFAGNLYKQIKDPDLIGSLTGHAPGSRAFKRYRAIDDEVKAQTVELLG